MSTKKGTRRRKRGGWPRGDRSVIFTVMTAEMYTGSAALTSSANISDNKYHELFKV